MQNALKTAFRFHLQKAAGYYFNGKPRALVALERARQDVAQGVARYPAPIKGYKAASGHDSDMARSVYMERPESHGLRLVGRVTPDFRYYDVWDKRESCGYYSNTFQDSLIFGLVYQLPARKGVARFVAAYGDSDGCGVLVDFSTIYTSAEHCSYERAQGNAAAIEAARAADSIAEGKAERARDYDSAWQAGAAWRDELEGVKQARQEALAILQERKAFKGESGFPALCQALKARVQDLRETMQEGRDRMASLANGDAENFWFWTGDSKLCAAFCDGADLDKMPA